MKACKNTRLQESGPRAAYSRLARRWTLTDVRYLTNMSNVRSVMLIIVSAGKRQVSKQIAIWFVTKNWNYDGCYIIRTSAWHSFYILVKTQGGDQHRVDRRHRDIIIIIIHSGSVLSTKAHNNHWTKPWACRHNSALCALIKDNRPLMTEAILICEAEKTSKHKRLKAFVPVIKTRFCYDERFH